MSDTATGNAAQSLRATMASIFGCPTEAILDNGRIGTVPGWDSLAHLRLILALEEKLGKGIPSRDSVRLITFKAILRYVENVTAQQAEPIAKDVTAADLRAAILKEGSAIGIGPGDCLLVHANIARALAVEGAADIVIEALESLLAPGGTLVMPAFSEEFVSGRPFDRRHPPTTVGLLADRFLAGDGVAISPHPYHRFAARGPIAEHLTAPHPFEDFGPDTPFARMVEANAKALMLSTDWDTFTFFHHLERLVQVPYRFNKEFVGTVIDGAERREERWLQFVRDLSIRNDFFPVARAFEASGAVATADASPFYFKSLNLRDLQQFTLPRLADDPYCLTLRDS